MDDEGKAPDRSWKAPMGKMGTKTYKVANRVQGKPREKIVAGKTIKWPKEKGSICWGK